MAKIYVAGRFTEKDAVKAVMRLLEEAGHEITHDWTYETVEGLTGNAVLDVFQGAADDDMKGVIDCDAFVLLHNDTCKGALVELGAALAWDKVVIIIGGRVENAPIFYWHTDVQHVADVPEALTLLGTLFPRAGGDGTCGERIFTEACAAQEDCDTCPYNNYRVK